MSTSRHSLDTVLHGADDGSSSDQDAATALSTEAGTASALDRFLDVSADMLVSGGSATTAAFDRYGLSLAASTAQIEDEDSEQQQQTQQQQAVDPKRHLSAKQRAALKQGQPHTGQQTNAASGKERQIQSNQQRSQAKPAATSATQQQQQQQQQQQPVRGKKTKAQKAKEKYANQDDEDRQLALSFLASAGTKKSRAERRTERKQRKEAKRKDGGPLVADTEQLKEAIQKATGRQFDDVKQQQEQQQQEEEPAGDSVESTDSGADGSEEDDETQQQQQQQQQWQAGNGGTDSGASATTADGATENISSSHSGALAIGHAQHGAKHGSNQLPNGSSAEQQQQQAGADTSGDEDNGLDDDAAALAAAATEAEHAEISALLAEENITEVPYADGDAAAAQTLELDSLTGCPTSDGVLLYAVPVCGPYSAMMNYKFKVKLIPGTVKKGKAAKQAVELLSRSPDIIQRERDLLRGVPDNDMISAMVGTVKLSMPGLQKIKATTKKAKKAAAQARGGGKR
eukprot:jgi/Chrzof1/10081/Cz04g26120.t1